MKILVFVPCNVILELMESTSYKTCSFIIKYDLVWVHTILNTWQNFIPYSARIYGLEGELNNEERNEMRRGDDDDDPCTRRIVLINS